MPEGEGSGRGRVELKGTVWYLGDRQAGVTRLVLVVGVGVPCGLVGRGWGRGRVELKGTVWYL